MAKVISLPSGNKVTVKDPADFTVKDRKFVLKDVSEDELDQISDLLNVLERVVVVLITDWTFDLIPPNIKPESLDELKTSDYDPILVEAKDALKFIMPNFGASESSLDDPKAVTAGSED
jgi:hypothetical protein